SHSVIEAIVFPSMAAARHFFLDQARSPSRIRRPDHTGFSLPGTLLYNFRFFWLAQQSILWLAERMWLRCMDTLFSTLAGRVGHHRFGTAGKAFPSVCEHFSSGTDRCGFRALLFPRDQEFLRLGNALRP